MDVTVHINITSYALNVARHSSRTRAARYLLVLSKYLAVLIAAVNCGTAALVSRHQNVEINELGKNYTRG